ncbi:hypothetical protein RHMOL_Rhmol13G0244800 [Rhododendron molle]|uniref:Uncharacterized protein n=1 Tax=Rhododendron molle TaxID=49168 RepID=A0ACC0LBB6_RHOML|nr:hypothetical protein RHMOL_Rhmol13G0244800 [Rhododendron molle]
MPFLRSSRKPIVLFIPILLVSYLVILSQVSVVEGGSTEHKTDKLIIGVPGSGSFENFVKITPSSENSNEKNYTGFCIRVFDEVQNRLKHPSPYEFVEFNGAYNDLVANVANKIYDAAVGDITILASRWEDVEFTEPFTESGLSMKDTDRSETNRYTDRSRGKERKCRFEEGTDEGAWRVPVPLRRNGKPLHLSLQSQGDQVA